MKRPALVAALTLAVGAAAFSQARADDPTDNPLTMIQSKDVFVPVGFDDNDTTLAVLDGYLPGTCYKLAFTQTTYDAATATFHLTQWARKYSGICIEVLVPFTSVVELGTLALGKYQVEGLGAGTTELNVTKALTTQPDDYFYAPVESANVRSDAARGRYVANIQGRFTNDCFLWQEIRVTDSGKTLEILPIVSIHALASCHPVETVFSKDFDLPTTLTPGRHLLHVRSLNGKSVNKVFTVNR